MIRCHVPWQRPLALLLALFAATAGIAGERFTLAIMPDVQQESASPRFADRLTWLVANREKLNLKAVFQVGDLMNFNDDAQYQHQSEGLKVLDAARMPYVLTLGNHDTAAVRVDGGSAAPGNVNLNLRNTAKFNHYFPLDRFRMLAGCFEPGKIDNAYHLFEAGGLKWCVINLELWQRTPVVDWAKSVADQFADRNIIIVTHAYLTGDSKIQQDNGGYGNNSPQYLYDHMVKLCPNVRLIFCGHTGVHGYRTDTIAGGATAYTWLQCYHDTSNNPVRLLTIDTQAGTMASRVYCPNLDKDKDDGSTRTVTGIKWVKPVVTAPRNLHYTLR